MGSVSVMLVRPLISALTDAEAFWRATDLTPQIVADDDARISAAQFCVAWSEALRLSGNRRLALDIASKLQPGAFGIVEYVCRASPTLGEALRQWVRYLNLLDDAVTVGLVVDSERVCVRVERESEAPAPASHELCWALLARHARELSTVPFRLVAVELAHPAPPGVSAFRDWFDAPVVFGAETTQLVFPAEAVGYHLRTADPALLAILTRAADELATKTARDPSLTHKVKHALSELLRTDDASIDVVARRLGMTGRSLQRRLKEEGTAFNTAREDVRRELAERYLADGLAINEISFLLGFSEPSAFFRAFKRWTGTTPLAHRRDPSFA